MAATHILFIFSLLLLLSSSHALARPVKKVTATVLLTNHKDELALAGHTTFTLQKEILPKISGRKMSSVEKKEKESKVAMAVAEGSGRRNGDQKKKWKDSFMAFTADYRTPKPHPPKNN